VEPVRGFLARYLRRRLVTAGVADAHGASRGGGGTVGVTGGTGTRCGVDEGLQRVVEWLPQLWQQLNRFIEAHNSTDVTIGRWWRHQLLSS